MNPNEQPQESDRSVESNPPEFGAPVEKQTFGQDFTASPEQAASAEEPAPVVSSPEPQTFGQPQNNQPAFGQPAFPSPQATPTGQPYPYSTENAGKTFGIISIILSVVGLPIIGIVLGVISRNKSKAAGAPTTVGTVGMVMGIVFTTLSLLVILPLFIIFFVLAAHGVQEGYKDASAKDSSSYNSSQPSTTSPDLASQAATVASKAEAYKLQAGDYPKYKSDFSTYPESTIDSSIYLYTAFVTSKNVTYLYCGPGAAQILYYKDMAGTQLDITPLGTASSTESCVKISQ